VTLDRSTPGFGRTYPIVLEPSDPVWPERFEREAAMIRKALGEVAVRIDHIGSTAVPGLAAKPVVDIQVSVPSLRPVEPYGGPLERLGYRHHSDDWPEHEFFSREEDGRRAFQIHVCEMGSEWERRHLAFRDHLRANPRDAARYEEVKRKAAARHPMDINAYLDQKDQVIREIERRALWEPVTDE
jgi:GrpB-like predicted nucleotidyltransferase (UPF0157 family)